MTEDLKNELFLKDWIEVVFDDPGPICLFAERGDDKGVHIE